MTTEKFCNCGISKSKHNVRHPFIEAKLPKYVLMYTKGKKFGSELRLLKNGTYFRDAGKWYVKWEFKDGVLQTVNPYGQSFSYLSGQLLKPITKTQYFKANKGYIINAGPD